MDDRLRVLAGRPVRSLQTFLREISFHYEIPRVIPDGIYGSETAAAVQRFQELFGLPATGKTDEETWVRVVEVYEEIVLYTAPPSPANIFPSCELEIAPGEKHCCLRMVQPMMNVISERFRNIPSVDADGVMNESCVVCVKKIQRIAGKEETGVLDRPTWEVINYVYHAFVNVFPQRKEQ